MKSIQMTLKQAAGLVCAITDVSVLPSELEEAIAASIMRIEASPGVSSNELIKDLTRHPKTIIHGEPSAFGPTAIRLAHAHALPHRAQYLMGNAPKGKPPVVVSHYKKGGTGKTTVLINTAIAMAAQGIRVLYIDADPQGTSTTLFGIDIEDPSLRTLHHVIFGAHGTPTPISDAVMPLYDNAVLDLIPSSIALAEFEGVAHASKYSERRFDKLLHKEEGFFSRYDLVLVDTNPGTNMLNFNLLFSATHILMPVSLDVPSMKSMHLMDSEAVELHEAGAGPKEKIIVGNIHQAATRHSQESLEVLQRVFAKQTAKTVLQAYAGVSRQGWMNEHGRTLIEREPTSPLAKKIGVLALELLERIIWAPRGLGVLRFEGEDGADDAKGVSSNHGATVGVEA